MRSSIILAAGESSRMGTPKPLLMCGEGTFLRVICDRLRRAGMDEVVVVLGAHAAEVRKGIGCVKGKVVVNRKYTEGQLSSLRCGLRALHPASRGALVTLVDHPLIRESTYAEISRHWEKTPDKIVLATYRGRGGHPVIFPRVVFGELMNAPLDEGARAVLRRDQQRVVRVELDDPGIVADIDRPEDYTAYMAQSREVPHAGR